MSESKATGGFFIPRSPSRATPVRQRASQAELRFLGYLCAASLVLGACQLAMGASAVIILLTLLSGAAALVPCLAYGLRRTVGVLFLMIWYEVSFGELITKTILLQPIDSNLFNPDLSHVIQLVGAASLSAGALIALWFVPLHLNVVRPRLDAVYLRVLSVVFFLMSMLAYYLDNLGLNAQAIAAFLHAYLFAALICELAARLVETRNRTSMSVWGGLLTLAICAISLANNAKTGFLVAGFCLFLTPFALGRAPSKALIAAFVPAFLFLTVALAPAIHVARSDRGRVDAIQMSEETASLAFGILTNDRDAQARVDELGRAEMRLDYGAYINRYLGHDIVWYDRFISIGYIDAVARRLTNDGPFVGDKVVLDETQRVLPRQFVGYKDKNSAENRITQLLGLTDPRLILSTTVPLPVELYSAGGYLFLILMSLALMALCSAMVNIVAFDFVGSVWSVFIIVTYGYFFAMQGYLGYLYFAVRQVPTDAFFGLLAMFLTTLGLWLHRRGNRSNPQASR